MPSAARSAQMPIAMPMPPATIPTPLTTTAPGPALPAPAGGVIGESGNGQRGSWFHEPMTASFDALPR